MNKTANELRSKAMTNSMNSLDMAHSTANHTWSVFRPLFGSNAAVLKFHACLREDEANQLRAAAVVQVRKFILSHHAACFPCEKSSSPSASVGKSGRG